MMIYHGTGVSRGVAAGPLYCYEPFVPAPPCAGHGGSAGEQRALYEAAKRTARKELGGVCARLEADKAAIFEAHMDILDDEVMDEEILAGIEGKQWTAQWAVEQVYENYRAMLGSAPDALIRERAADLYDVKLRLLRILQGAPERSLSCLEQPVIVAAKELLPSDTATMDRANVLGIVTETGGATSHSAIIAKSWGIPAVLGVAGLMQAVRHGETAVVDAGAGTLEMQPSPERLAAAQAARGQWQRQMKEEAAWLDKEPFTKDGVRIDLGLNIGSAAGEELEAAQYAGFAGLLRTEFLYMDADHFPTEDEQAGQYEKVLRAFGQRPVVLRTLDIGGDKTLRYFQLPREDNPFLGSRALRLCFENPEMFLTQLRAALRAAVHGNLWLMFPMVGSLEDVRRAKGFVEQARRQLARRGERAGEVKLGAMIEVPSAALMAPELAREVDFASIGTNDLCQYLTAADRMNPAMAPYYQSWHPALFRLIGMAAQAFEQAGRPLCVCGELGGDALAAPALVGLGLRKLSMSASSLARVKKALAGMTLGEMRSLAARVTACADEEQVKKVLCEAKERDR